MNSKYKTVADSQVVFSELMLPSRANFNGKIHGGYILSLLDQIAFACASKHSENYCVTASVDTVDFLAPIEIGELVTLKASVNFIGTSSMVIGIRVDAENIQTGIKKHCNSSYFTMVAKSKTNENVKVPGLILSSSNEVRRFMREIIRRDLKSRYTQEFHKTNFKALEVHEILENYRIQLNFEETE